MCNKCSNTDGLSGCWQCFTIAKPYCSELTCTYNEIKLTRLLPSNRIAGLKDSFHFQVSSCCQTDLQKSLPNYASTYNV